MEGFAHLLDRLVLTPQRNGKLHLMVDHFRETSDPDRGWGLAAITRDLEVQSVKTAQLRELIYERMDPVLFDMSYDYVGDLAEAIALTWPRKPGANRVPELHEIVEALHEAPKGKGAVLVERWLDALDASGRFALLKLVTGGLRIGVSARLAKQAVAQFGDVPVEEVEELWHGLSPPYESLFAWMEGRAPKPVSAALAPFRPVMLSHPLEEPDHAKIDPRDYAAEWKWDGIRVQATSEGGERRIYSRTGDDIGRAFPDVLEALDFDGSLDGELLVARRDADAGDGEVEIAPFGDLQQRLNRKSLSRKLLDSHPAFLRVYDLLQEGADDLRPLPFEQRRERLEAFVAAHPSERLDLSPLIPFESLDELAALRADPPKAVMEGLMLKRWDSAYVPGRPKGPWFKWKRDPHLVDAVMMYAQRGHGRRSSFYSDYTFGVWSGDPEDPSLVPVGKAYFGFTDEELKTLDRYVRNNTVERFGPVRSVRADTGHGLVLEIAFEGLNRSTRHKSGVAMRFPRVNRIRWDKPAGEADWIGTLEGMLDT